MILERYAKNVIANLQEFTVDDLHVLDNTVKELGYDKRVFGAICKSLESQRLIEKICPQASIREECHHRTIVRWRVLF